MSSAINDLGLDRRSGAELISQGLNALSLPESDQETCLWEGCGIMMNSLKELVAHIIKQHVQVSLCCGFIFIIMFYVV